MLKTYKEEMLLRTSQCDLMGQWRPSAILETMQELAGTHSELLGVGRNALIERQGVVWILTRIEVVMDRYPRIGEHIAAETFPMPLKRWFFPRYFTFRDERGEEIGPRPARCGRCSTCPPAGWPAPRASRRCCPTTATCSLPWGCRRRSARYPAR